MGIDLQPRKKKEKKKEGLIGDFTFDSNFLLFLQVFFIFFKLCQFFFFGVIWFFYKKFSTFGDFNILKKAETLIQTKS